MKLSISNWHNFWARLGRNPNTKRSRRIARRSLKFESLEARQMMAADLSLGSDAGYDDDGGIGNSLAADYLALDDGDMAAEELAVESLPKYPSASEPASPIDDNLIDELMAEEQFASETEDYLSDSGDEFYIAEDADDEVASYDESDATDESDSSDLSDDDSVITGPWEIPEDLAGPNPSQYPHFDSQQYSKDLREDAEPGLLLTVSAEDLQNDKVTYSIDTTEYRNPNTGRISQVTDDLFTIDADTGAISLNAALDYEAVQHYTVRLHATDSDGNAGNAWVDVNVQDVEESPRFDSRSYAVDVSENTAGPLETVSASDPQSDPTNPDLHPLTYSLTDDMDGLFEIDEKTGEISLARPLDYEAAYRYHLHVNVNDPDGYHDTASVYVNVLDVDEAPVVTSTDTATFRENTTDDFHSLAADDPENRSITFAIVGGIDGHRFDLDYGALKLKEAVNFEEPSDANDDNIYEVEIEAQDPGGNTATQTVRVTISDVNEAPTFTKDEFVFMTSERVVENGLALGPDLVSAEDVDGDSLTFSIDGNTSSRGIAVDADSGKITIANRDVVRSALKIYHKYETTVTIRDKELSTTAKVVIYDDYRPYLQDVENYIGQWHTGASAAVIVQSMAARDATQSIADFLGDAIEGFGRSSRNFTGFTFAATDDIPLLSLAVDVIRDAVSKKMQDGADAVVDHLQQTLIEIQTRSLEAVDERAVRERAELSMLVADIQNDPPDVQTRKVVEYLGLVVSRNEMPSGVPSREALYVQLLLQYARQHGWKLQGNGYNLRHFGYWWHAPGAADYWGVDATEIADELNRLKFYKIQ